MCCAVCSTVPTDLFVCLIISSARSLRYKKRGGPPLHRRRRPLLWHTIGVITARRTLCTRRGQNVNGSLVFDQLCKRVIKPSAKRRGEARGRHRGQVEGRRSLPRLRMCRPPGPQPPKSGENRGTRSARYQFAKVVASFIRTCAMFTKRGTQCRYQIGQILNKTGLISTVVIVTPAEDGTRRGWSAAHPD